MNTFNNMERSGYDEIVSYGPSWWTEYREMDAVYRFAGWTLDLMALWLEKIIQNQFPSHMDAATCAVFEKILKLHPAANATLALRRAGIAMLYPNTGKVSASLIKQLIQFRTGYNVEIWNEGGRICVRIMRDGTSVFWSRAITTILDSTLPAHVAHCGRADCAENMEVLIGVGSQVYESVAVDTDDISLAEYAWYGDEEDVIYVDDDNNVLIA